MLCQLTVAIIMHTPTSPLHIRHKYLFIHLSVYFPFPFKIECHLLFLFLHIYKIQCDI